MEKPNDGLRQVRPKFEGKHADLSERIINVFFKAHFELGYGFILPKFKRVVYDNDRKGSLKWIQK